MEFHLNTNQRVGFHAIHDKHKIKKFSYLDPLQVLTSQYKR